MAVLRAVLVFFVPGKPLARRGVPKTAEGSGVEFYGLAEGKERPEDLRTVWESEKQVQEKLGDSMTMFGREDAPFQGSRQEKGPSFTGGK